MFDPLTFSRRQFLERSAMGFGSLALAHLVGQEGRASEAEVGPGGSDLLPRVGHFPARARSVILLMQNGGPSQVDLFDPKPELHKRNGQRHPQKVESFQPGSQANLLMGSCLPLPEARRVRHGAFRTLAAHRLRGRRHLPCALDGGGQQQPSAGAALYQHGENLPRPAHLRRWVSYALGTHNQNLPAYVVLRDPDGYNNGGTTLWENGWLPAVFGGTEIQSRSRRLEPAPRAAAPLRGRAE